MRICLDTSARNDPAEVRTRFWEAQTEAGERCGGAVRVDLKAAHSPFSSALPSPRNFPSAALPRSGTSAARHDGAGKGGMGRPGHETARASMAGTRHPLATLETVGCRPLAHPVVNPFSIQHLPQAAHTLNPSVAREVAGGRLMPASGPLHHQPFGAGSDSEALCASRSLLDRDNEAEIGPAFDSAPPDQTRARSNSPSRMAPAGHLSPSFSAGRGDCGMPPRPASFSKLPGAPSVRIRPPACDVARPGGLPSLLTRPDTPPSSRAAREHRHGGPGLFLGSA